MATSRITQRAASGSVVGFGISLAPVVIGGPTYTAAKGDNAPLEFHVYDRTNSAFLGALTKFVGKPSWSEELNGPGVGSLRVALNDPALEANPDIMDDDNIVVARLYGQDVFSWRVQSGDDTLIDKGEDADRYIEFSGPGSLNSLSEAIVRPEFPITGDPTSQARERFFGYMSKRPPTALTLSTTVRHNLVKKPNTTAAADWAHLLGSSVTDWNLSHEVAGGENGEAVAVFTCATFAPEYDAFTYETTGGGFPISRLISSSLRVKADTEGYVQLFVKADTGEENYGGYTLLPAGEWVDVKAESLQFSPGTTSFRLALVLAPSVGGVDSVVKVYEPMVEEGAIVSGFLAGDLPAEPNWVYSWDGAANNSASTRTYQALVTPELQPSWYAPSLWSKPYKVTRKSQATSGTGQFSPEGWMDSTAFLMWPSSPIEPTAPGTVYWRKNFTMIDSRAVFVQAAADNQMRMWLDGVEIITSGFDGDGTDIVGSWEGVLSPGEHLLAAETTNYKSPNPGDNFGWLLSTVMFKVNNEPVGVISHSDASWECFYEGDATLPRIDRTVTSVGTKSTTTEKTVPVTYTVRSGDTLSAIGGKFGVPWRDIYNANKEQIDARAARSGLANKGPGWWIFPGQVLDIPGSYTTTSVTSQVPTTITTIVSEWAAGVPLSTNRPGWYPYQMLARLVQEAKDRRVKSFENLSFGFSFGLDSEGVAWSSGFDAVVERSFSVGASVLDAALQLVEGGLDIRMLPGMVLAAYRQMGDYRGINSPEDIRFILLDRGGVTMKYSVKRRTELYNALLIDTDAGWRDYATVGDEAGRAEGSVSLGGMDSANITKVIGSELEELSKRTKTVETTFLFAPGRRPYLDFDLGDVVVAHDSRGRQFDARITAIGVSFYDEGDLRCEVSASGEGVTS